MADEELAPIPQKSKLPKPKKAPHTPAINNLAGDEELVKKLREWIGERFSQYDVQPARTRMMEDGGIMDQCDRMWRMSAQLYESDRQLYNRTLYSNLPSSVFYQNVKNRISLHLMGMIPRDDADLPADYAPQPNSADYTDQDGMAVAAQANAWERYVFEGDKRYKTIVNGILWNEINSMQIWCNEWVTRKEVLAQKKITRWEGEAVKMPVEWDTPEELVTTYDGPEVFLVDAKDFWANADIDGDNLNDNICVIRRARKTNTVLLDGYAEGLLMNVNKLGPAQLFQDDLDSSDDPESRRKLNAGESPIAEKSGLYIVWYVDSRVPIKEGEKGKAEWDPKGTRTALYRSVWAGSMIGTQICLQIVRRPNGTERFPYVVTYSHKDQKGFYHTGWGAMLGGGYWQSCKMKNQLVDGIDLRQQKPWLVDGQILGSDLTYGPERIWRMAPGSRLHQPVVDDASQSITLGMKTLDEDVAKTVGISGPLAMQQARSHTPATDVKLLNEHAMRPIEMDTGEIADALYLWMFETDYHRTTLFVDPKLALTVTHLGKPNTVSPGKLWGPLNVKVRVVTDYYETMSKRAEILAFMNGGAFPLAMRAAGEQGQRIFFRKLFKEFRYLGDSHDEIFPMKVDYDATNRARNENYAMLIAGEWVEAHPDDNHDVHYSIHDSLERQQAFLPEDQRPSEDNMNKLRAHKLRHEQFRSQALAATRPQAAQPGAMGEWQGPQGAGEKLLEGVSGGAGGLAQ